MVKSHREIDFWFLQVLSAGPGLCETHAPRRQNQMRKGWVGRERDGKEGARVTKSY